jgi:hypothetical protein
MAVVYSNLEDDVSLYEELLGLEGAYSALSELLWELSSGHVSRDHVTRILDPLNKRFALVCERVQVGGSVVESCRKIERLGSDDVK